MHVVGTNMSQASADLEQDICNVLIKVASTPSGICRYSDLQYAFKETVAPVVAAPVSLARIDTAPLSFHAALPLAGTEVLGFSLPVK